MDAMEQLSCDCTVTPLVSLEELLPGGSLSIPQCPPDSCLKDEDGEDVQRKKRDISQSCIYGNPSKIMKYEICEQYENDVKSEN